MNLIIKLKIHLSNRWLRLVNISTQTEHFYFLRHAEYLQRKFEAQQYKLKVEKQLVSKIPIRNFPTVSLFININESLSQSSFHIKDQDYPPPSLVFNSLKKNNGNRLELGSGNPGFFLGFITCCVMLGRPCNLSEPQFPV